MKKNNASSNIWKIYAIKAIRSGLFSISIAVPFFRENGLTMKEIMLLQSIFAIAVISLEVPTGYFADRYGRKVSILIGGIISTIGYSLYAMSYSFDGFLLAEIVLGVGLGFVSGADTAMLYDTLSEYEKENEYKKVQGKNDSIGMISEAVTGLIGGAMALVSLRFPFYWDIGLAFLVIPLALTLSESKIHGSADRSIKQMLTLIKFSLQDRQEILWLTIYSGIVSASTLAMFWFTQAYWLAAKMPLEFFGILYAAPLVVSAFFSWNAHVIEKWLGRKKSLIILVILPAIGYFILSSYVFAWFGIFISLFYVVRGISNPVISDYINGLVPSDIRATILSVKNLFGRLIFSLLGPFLGWISESISLQAALAISGSIFLFSGVVALIFMHRRKVL